MVDVVKNNLDRIIDVCKKHHVKSLYVFGSAARAGDFTTTSDVDFLVDFEPLPVETNDDITYKVANYDGLLESLQTITQRKVDLVQEQQIRNKYLRYFINKDKTFIYGIS